jgi:hypothetical protein
VESSLAAKGVQADTSSMPDTNQIKPALSVEEWAERSAIRGNDGWEVAVESDESGISFRWRADSSGGDSIGVPVDGLPVVIALANAALPDGDKRKITRAHIEALMDGVKSTGDYKAEELYDILAAILPPESP